MTTDDPSRAISEDVDVDTRVETDDAGIVYLSLRDPAQFEALFRRHAATIHRYVVRRIGTQAADDVVGETFLIAFRRRAGYRHDQPDARPWLYGIATNLLRRHWRGERKQLRLLARTGIDPVVEPFADQVHAAVVAADARPRLAAALADLPAAQRDALLLVAWGELSYQQVADATGVPLGTVQSRLNRARQRLRTSLEDLMTEREEQGDLK